MRVELRNLTKRWGSVVGADSVDLEIQDGEFVAFLGPSGCGKTTTLLMIAGIYKPTAGEIYFDDRLVNHVAPKDRNIGMVFQSYALYPHMTVYQNISYPLKLQKLSKEEMQRKAQKVADMMGIGHLMDRKPSQLSGGQQQRVALGRALVKEPHLLLFDEPLSNLDARLRLSMRGEIKRLQKELGITSIYVTHDQVEAMTMADRIALIKDGILQAYATPEELYDRPRTLFIAGFVGNPPMNFIDVEVVRDNGGFRACCSGFDVRIPQDRGEKAFGKGQLILGIRPEDIMIVPEESTEGGEKPIAGEIYVVEPLGRDDLLDVRIGGTSIHVLADPTLGLKMGEIIHLEFNTHKVQFFDPVSEQSLLWD